ncbi:hypothetical protein ACOMHN_009879 [Nucella lapillus]
MMELLKLFLPVGLTILVVTQSCCSLEDVDIAEGAVDVDSGLNPSQPSLKTEQLQDTDEDNSIRKQNSEDSASTRSDTPSELLEETRNQEGDTASSGAQTEDGRVESKRLNDEFEGESSTDTEDNTETRKSSPDLVLQAFGPVSSDDEDETGSQSGLKEEIWTEQTEDGTAQKRSGSRRFFSLMNLIKFLLNPVIQEFQEMDKSSTGQETAAVTSTDSNNQSKVADVSTGNSSDVGDQEKKNGTESGKKTKFQCVGRNVTENTTATVRIVNSTVLLEVLGFDKNHSSADCVLVMFYAPWCHFCAATAPHYNAVARAFPHLEVLAVDTVHFSNLNARFGTVAVPNIMLFHQSRSAVRFNHTERHFDTLLQFITNTTGLEANSSVELSSEDYEGPLSSSPTEESDYLLWFAWVFIVVCSGHIFISSEIGQTAIERVMVLWQEHQHQHIE